MDDHSRFKRMRLPTRLDRYPAKMVWKLADRLVERYASDASAILDPFCGSGAVLVAACRRLIRCTGIDLNPVAELFCQVKLRGFDGARAFELAQHWIDAAEHARQIRPISWEAKHYWFTPKTLEKFERLRYSSTRLGLTDSTEGLAVLMSTCLAVRLCSRADQRSPKPFISKRARNLRSGRHFDPYKNILSLLHDLTALYGRPDRNAQCAVLRADVPNSSAKLLGVEKYSHVITSPPYINAQDYFRNFKLELHVLEGMLPFQIGDIKEQFIGTDRGDLLNGISKEEIQDNIDVLPELRMLQARNARLCAVVQRYLHDMRRTFDVVQACVRPNGCLIVVCGDNLVSGVQIRTWNALQRLIELQGFELFDRFSDPIGDRLLPPKRCGHKGLIKHELVSAFRKKRPPQTLTR